MNRSWADLVQPAAHLNALYTSVPPLVSVTVRSIRLDRFGPSLTLRIDLPVFPQRPPQEWSAAGLDRLQCQLRFIAVEHLDLTGWNPPATADVRLEECGARRIRVTAHSRSFGLTFEAADTVLIGHLSAFTAGEGETDAGPHQFVGKLDAHRFDRIPGLEERTFYERI